ILTLLCNGFRSAASQGAHWEMRKGQLMANEPLEKLGFKDLIEEKSEAKPEKL
uniref:Uncharacterized protein n=1 Tax=Bubo bubo TaxID=30461 RepID=A0A8C0FFZ1_BUBBB